MALATVMRMRKVKRDNASRRIKVKKKKKKTFFYKQPRPVSTLLKGLIRWLVHIHYNQKALTKTEYSTLILNKREPILRCMTAN
jgi:hypothetical protein